MTGQPFIAFTPELTIEQWKEILRSHDDIFINSLAKILGVNNGHPFQTNNHIAAIVALDHQRIAFAYNLLVAEINRHIENAAEIFQAGVNDLTKFITASTLQDMLKMI